MIFAAGLVLEREPLQWSEFPAALVVWVQIVGTIAAIGLALWLLATWLGTLLTPAKVPTKLGAVLRAQLPGPEGKIFLGALGVAAVLYAVAALWILGQSVGLLGADEAPPPPLPGMTAAPAARSLFGSGAELFFTLGSIAALLTVSLPLLTGLFGRLSGRRIWALARLSLKEARHSRVVLIFSLMAIIFLFADWFVPYKPEDQLRNYVRAIYWTMPFLFLMTAGILGAFTIPNDLRRQTIHTIVTKPVERFEIFLGRFLGFGLLITLGMLVLTGLSLLYVVRGVGKAAEDESRKARKPIYGTLTFSGTRSLYKGDNVGRMWEYRSYITARPSAANLPRQYAIWAFDEIPDFGDQESGTLEFTFDIFRLSKGIKERPGIPCTFLFVDGRLSIPEVEEIVSKKLKKRQNELADAAGGGLTPSQIDDVLIKELGVYSRSGEPVIDYHTQGFDVPTSFFTKIRESLSTRSNDGLPAFKVIVEVEEDRITQQTQMLGVARRDLYFLPYSGSFEFNFFKGMIGVWFLVLLVLGVALALSTYLSGVIALLFTVFLFFVGMNREFIAQVATGKAEGGGPIEASIRLAKGRPLATPLEPSAGYELVKVGDNVFRGAMQVVLKVLPDPDRFDLHEYVASGFDISWSQVLLLDNFMVPFLGYLIPWAILAYYLLRFREVANPG